MYATESANATDTETGKHVTRDLSQCSSRLFSTTVVVRISISHHVTCPGCPLRPATDRPTLPPVEAEESEGRNR